MITKLSKGLVKQKCEATVSQRSVTAGNHYWPARRSSIKEETCDGPGTNNLLTLLETLLLLVVEPLLTGPKEPPQGCWVWESALPLPPLLEAGKKIFHTSLTFTLFWVPLLGRSNWNPAGMRGSEMWVSASSPSIIGEDVSGWAWDQVHTHHGYCSLQMALCSSLNVWMNEHT